MIMGVGGSRAQFCLHPGKARVFSRQTWGRSSDWVPSGVAGTHQGWKQRGSLPPAPGPAWFVPLPESELFVRRPSPHV